LPFQGGPPAYVDVAMVDERRRERRAFAAKCVGKAVRRIAGAFSQSGRPATASRRSGESRPRFWARPPASSAFQSLPSADLTVGAPAFASGESLSGFSTRSTRGASRSSMNPRADLCKLCGSETIRAVGQASTSPIACVTVILQAACLIGKHLRSRSGVRAVADHQWDHATDLRDDI
jgi:hypothetical protein